MVKTAWQLWADQLATGLALVDAERRLRWINPALAEVLEIGPRHAIGQPLRLLSSEEGVAQVKRALGEQQPIQWRGVSLAMAGRSDSADIVLQPFEDGLLLEVHVLAKPSGSASPLSATLRGFAHEVKNPLAGLRGAAQLLQRRLIGKNTQALTALIINEADRLATLANRLLHHDGAARLGPVNIHQLLKRLCELLQAEPAPPRLRQDYDPSLPDVYGDADRLLQILLNLARNSMEAGALTLTLRTRVEHAVRLEESVLRMALRVDVVDDGGGVPANLYDTLFQPLVSGRPEGTGLGLALSREIARDHGGDLRNTSGSGETTFSLYLPLEQSHARA